MGGSISRLTETVEGRRETSIAEGETVKDDEGFLFILNKLRSWAMSDRVYYPLHKSAVEIFLDWEDTTRRLEDLSATTYAEKVKELMTAIQQGER